MPLNLPVFYQRTTSAIVFGAIMLTGLFWNEWAFLVLVCAIQFLCFREYVMLMKKINSEIHWPNALVSVFQAISILLLVIFAALTSTVHEPNTVSAYIPLAIYNIVSYLWYIIPILPVILLIAGMLAEKPHFTATFLSIGGMLYITLPMLFLLHMRHTAIILPIAMIVMIWTNDTMAYLVGSFIGKTPFSPISPKKTWEGTVGGALLTIAGAAVYGYFAHRYRLADWMAIATCVAVAGTLGDLMESRLKRMAGVKDSGSMMPGHGGAMDRFDSLLVATPFVFAYVIFFM